jgi:hypothetical protein
VTPSPKTKTTPVVYLVAYLSPGQHSVTSVTEALDLLSPGRDPWIFVLFTLKQKLRDLQKGKSLRGLRGNFSREVKRLATGSMGPQGPLTG